MQSITNRKIRLSGEWQFMRGDAKLYQGRENHAVCYGMTKAGGWLGTDDTFEEMNAWKTVQVPHDWANERAASPDESPSNGYKERGTGWYFRKFTLPPEMPACVLLEFEGVMSRCEVFVNGTLAGSNESGYTGFFCDITDLAVWNGENVVAVHVDANRCEGWWYEGAGIYRPVFLHILPPTHFLPQGIFAYARRREGGWEARVEATCAAVENCEFSVEILDAQGHSLASDKRSLVFSGEEALTVGVTLHLENPPEWTPETPNLTRLVARLLTDNGTDEREIPFGVREVEWDSERGLLLNGKPIKVRGICCHQDHAGVGTAIPRAVTFHRIRLLKEMGCNAYRCAHHCPSQDLLDACDQLGMLVMAENRHFAACETVLAQVDAMVLACRNHPCVFLYSVFNEEPWANESRGKRIASTLRRRIRSLDDTRKVTAAIHRTAGSLGPVNASDAMDVIGINYALNDYAPSRARRQDTLVLGTENSPTYATRGVYQTSAETHQFASVGESAFGPENALCETMKTVDATAWAVGCFVWCGFDYRGEPYPYEWPSVRCHWGFADACGFFKDTAYLLKAYYSEEKVLHLLPFWNFAEGQTVRVTAFTNLISVTLYVNGSPQGERLVQNRTAEWLVPFEAGTICVRGRAADGTMLSDEVQTPGRAVRIAAERLLDGEIAIVNFTALDEANRFVPDECGELRMEPIGCELLGCGNGDPNAASDGQAAAFRLFNGHAQAIFRIHPGARLRVQCEFAGAPPQEMCWALDTWEKSC